MKRFLLWMGIALATPVALFLLLAFLLYLPPVQDFAVSRVAAYASSRTGMDISVERLRLRFPLDLDLQGLSVRDAAGDTLLAAASAVADLDLSGLFSQRVGLDAVTLSGAQVDTKNLVASAVIRGRLGTFALHDDVNLRDGLVVLRSVEASDLDLDIALRDTVTEEDTATTALPWLIDIRHAEVRAARLRLATPGDSFAVAADIGRIAADGGRADLLRQRYTVARAELSTDTLTLTASRIPMAFGPLTLGADSIDFDGERGHLALPAAGVHTATSRLTAAADMDFAALVPGGGGRMRIDLQTDLGREDVLNALGSLLPKAAVQAYPSRPLNVQLAAEGHLDSLHLTRLSAAWPGLVYAEGEGEVGRLLATDSLRADIAFHVEAKELDWLRPLAGEALKGIRLPAMQVGGTFTAEGPQYGLDALLCEGAGRVALKASVDTRDEPAYSARAAVSRLDVRHFLPRDSIGLVSFSASLHGQGTDLLAPGMSLTAEAEVSQLQYGHFDLTGLGAEVQVAGGKGHVGVSSDNALLTMAASVDALLARQADLTFGVELSRADLQALGLTARPMKTSMCLHLDGTTDLSRRHAFSGTVSDIVLVAPDSLFRLPDIALDGILRPDTTHLYLSSGDLLLTANGRTSYDHLLDQLNHFTDELHRQADERRIDTDALTRRLPQIDLHVRSGNQNPFHGSLHMLGYDYEALRLDLNTDPVAGLNGGGHVYRLNTGSILLDTIALHTYQDSTGVKMDARIRNGRRNPQFTFDARMNAYLLPSGAGATLTYFDDRGRQGVSLGLAATMEEEGIRVHLDPLDPVIAYRTFHLNESNYVLLGHGGRLTADVDLLADDGTGVKLYSPPDTDALQDLSVSVNRLNLGELTSVLPYAPRLTGFLHGDAHLIQTTGHMSVSTDLTVNDLTFERAPLGQVGLQAVYLPNADGSHFVDGTLSQTGMPVATFSGTYTPQASEGQLDVDATLERFPFALANGFIPEGMATLEGVGIGELHVGGTTSRPVVDGMLATSGLRLRSDMYSLDLRFRDDTIQVRGSDLQLDRIEAYSAGQTPLVFDGGVRFTDPEHLRVDLTMAATGYELINARKTARSVAYGKVFVDVSAMLQGTLDDLRMMGRLKVLGDTDVTYVLTDSPLSADDQLADLVEFVDFGDSTRVLTEAGSRPQNLNIAMSVQIDDAAQVHCLLSPDRSSYVDIEGGGDLMLTYSPEKELQLNGRYTIHSGTLKYTMMVIPLKEFSIKSGSYVEFRGPLLNPTLNLAATERLRTTVTENDRPRSVSFDVGMDITQTLENLGLEFTLEAPEDMGIQNELATMSTEQRGRVAVTMLATGMYITDAGSATGGGFTGQNALNALLQSQISNITGKALKSVDLSVGMEQGTSASGTTTTDYSFRFAKRFWGNRVSVIVGGKVSTGEDARNTGESIIDNVSIEYRLDRSATRYVNLFYDKNYESLLDGEVIEMGGGLVLRRKTSRLGELFLFRKNSQKSTP